MGGRSRAREGSVDGDSAGDLESGTRRARSSSTFEAADAKKSSSSSKSKRAQKSQSSSAAKRDVEAESSKRSSKKKTLSKVRGDGAIKSGAVKGGAESTALAERLRTLLPKSYSSWGAWILVTLITFYAIDVFTIAKSGGGISDGDSSSGATVNSNAALQQQQPAVVTTASEAHAAGIQAAGHDASSNIGTNSAAVAPSMPSKSGATQISVASDSDGTTGAADGTAGENDAAGGGAGVYRHPMNRGVERLWVNGGTEELSADQVKEAYRRLVLTYLHPFRKGIARDAFFTILNRKSYGVTPEGANKGTQSILFQVVGGRVYMFDPYKVAHTSKDFYRARINEMIWLLSEMSVARRIHDTEFLVSIHDCVQTASAHHTYRSAKYIESNPSFTIVACNFSDNVPFPMWEGDVARGGGYATWDEKMRSYAS